MLCLSACCTSSSQLGTPTLVGTACLHDSAPHTDLVSPLLNQRCTGHEECHDRLGHGLTLKRAISLSRCWCRHSSSAARRAFCCSCARCSSVRSFASALSCTNMAHGMAFHTGPNTLLKYTRFPTKQQRKSSTTSSERSFAVSYFT